MMNLKYDAAERQLLVDLPNLITAVRNIDINSTKIIYSECYGKLLLPTYVFETRDLQQGEKIEMCIIDINIA
jgi:hypothetical protein